MGRILAIDFGTKRIGLAVTDSLQMIAGPLKTVTSEEALPFIVSYCEKEKVEIIVLGEPKHLDGSASGPQEAIQNFLKALERKLPAVKMERMDERFTSKLAFDSMIMGGATKKQRQDKSMIDTVSAVIILQSFMEQRAFRRG